MARLLAAFATLALAASLAACAYPYTVALIPGQSAALPDGQLRYLRLANDSRCKPDVQCVWAGDAVIDLQWSPTAGSARNLSLHLNPQAGPSTAKLDTRQVSFTHLAQGQPQASLRIDRAD